MGECRRSREKSPQGCLSGLFMADSKSWFLLGGLYMAPFPQYAEYELRNSSGRTRVFPFFVPYVSEVAFPNCRNLPYVSGVVGPQVGNHQKLTPLRAPRTLRWPFICHIRP